MVKIDLGIKKGKEFWDQFNTILGLSLYTIFLIIMLIDMTIIPWILGIYAMVIPIYLWRYEVHKSEMERRRKGTKIVEGWVTHGYGVGEPIWFYPAKFELIERLSPDDAKSVTDYVNNLRRYGIKPEVGLDRFKPKQLTYKDIAEIKAMNTMERKKFDEEEEEEFKVFVGDYKKMKLHEQNNKDEDEKNG